MEMVVGLLEAATKTVEGTSRGGIGAGDAVATVGGAMDDVAARRGAAGSAGLKAGNTSAPSSVLRSSRSVAHDAKPGELGEATHGVREAKRGAHGGVEDEMAQENGQAQHPWGRGERQRHVIALDLRDARDVSRMTLGDVGGSRVAAGGSLRLGLPSSSTSVQSATSPS
jgi:hypothetical protein